MVNVTGFDDSGMFGLIWANGFMFKSRTFGPSCFVHVKQSMGFILKIDVRLLGNLAEEIEVIGNGTIVFCG